jgi:DNA invertase Pin-like site-specific DNA recombinase
MIKVALYTRVSLDELNSENQSIQLKEYCRLNGLDIVKEYGDVISGYKENRPDLNQMLIDIRDKVSEYTAVVCWKLDRLGRNLSHLVRVVGYFQKHGIDLIVTTQKIDTTTPSGKLMFHIIGAMAEFERDLISERTKAGIVRARQAGKQIGRKMGQKDVKKRKTEGYSERYRKDRVIL